MAIRQEPAGKFAAAQEKVAAAQAEAQAIAIRDYADRVRVALTTYDGGGDGQEFLRTTQEYLKRVLNEIRWVSPPG